MAKDHIDLRSDTFTVPDDAMRQAMASADVGDDVWGEDPTVIRLEHRIAELLNKEAAVYVPSGTMGNLVAIAAQTRPGDEIIVDAQSHIAWYEVGGAAVVAGVQLRTIDARCGMPTADEVEGAIRTADIHQPGSRLLCVENTHNRRGGAAIPQSAVDAAAAVAHAHGLRVHCDGARLFNAAVALDVSPAALVASCDSVTVCLSKGLGAPVGSVIAGDAAFVDDSRRWRKRLGGGMRQAGIVAAGGLHALDHNVSGLAQDHANARLLADAAEGIEGVRALRPDVPTNIVMLECDTPADVIVDRAAAMGLLLMAMGPHLVRCMTFRGVSRADAARAAAMLQEIVTSGLVMAETATA